MNLKNMYNAQRQLDEHILKEHPVQPGEDRKQDKLLALQVELAELVNECPDTFKFWSNKPRQREKALYELADCIHFMLSIGNDIGFDEYDLEVAEITQGDMKMREYFAWTFKYNARLADEINGRHAIYHYKDVLTAYIQLSQVLGFTWDEVEAAYYEKNKLNHIRQENAY